jgi:hypothetical protein
MNMYYAKTGSGQTSWRNMLRKAENVFSAGCCCGPPQGQGGRVDETATGIESN